MRTIALISLFKVILAKNAAILDETSMIRVIGKNLLPIMEKVQEDDDS